MTRRVCYVKPGTGSRSFSASGARRWARSQESAESASTAGGRGRAPCGLDHVERPLEARLVGVRWVATDDEDAPRGIEPALDVVVHMLGSASGAADFGVPEA